MTKRSFSPGMVLSVEQQHPRSDHSRVYNSQEKRQRLKPKLVPSLVRGGLVIPDDVADLCDFMDDGGIHLAEDNTVLPSDRCCSEREALQRKRIRRLKIEKRALRQDLARSRQIGNALESDMKRLHHQRQKEMSCERRSQRNIQTREKAVIARERACSCLEQDLEHQKVRLESEVLLYEHTVVHAVVRDLMNLVELSVIQDQFQDTKEALALSVVHESNCRQYAVWVEQEIQETEAFVIIEQQLIKERLQGLAKELEVIQHRLQEEKQASDQLKATNCLLQQENACKTKCIAGLALSNTTLVKAQIEQTAKFDAKEEDRNRNARQQQQKHEKNLAECTKQRNRFQTENSQLQQQLREAQLGELKSQQKICAAQEKSKLQQETLEAKVKTLRQELKAIKRAQLKAESSVGRLRTLRNTEAKR